MQAMIRMLALLVRRSWFWLPGGLGVLICLGLGIGSPSFSTSLHAQEPAPFTPLWSSGEDIAALGMAWGDMDNDGDLDLALGRQATVYRAQNGTLEATPFWTAAQTEATRDLAWSDVDGNGLLDLILANNGAPHQVYFNTQGTLAAEPGWESATHGAAVGIAPGDIDNDGDSDLLIAEQGDAAQVVFYRNDGGQFSAQPVWSISEQAGTINSLALGDFDQDGDSDLALGTSNGVAVYQNNNATFTPYERNTTLANVFSVAWGYIDPSGSLVLAVGGVQSLQVYALTETGFAPQPVWSAQDADNASHMMWGDHDGDGDSDLVVGNLVAAARVYDNQDGTLSPEATWSTAERGEFWRVAWGDIDNDGDLDLALGRIGAHPALIYRNERPPFPPAPDWKSETIYAMGGMAWGDYDNDGDLDLAVGDINDKTHVHENEDGVLTPTPVWIATEHDETRSVAWGDYDGDGDLDLITGNFDQPTRLYENRAGELTPAAVQSLDTGLTMSVAWGDYDDDGDLDLAVGNSNHENRLYRNTGDRLEPVAVWRSNEHDDTRSVAWGDYDGDGDLDLAVGNATTPNRLYRNDTGRLAPAATWLATGYDGTASVAWGDYDGDGDLDLAAGTSTGIQLHRNNQGTLSRTAHWSSPEETDIWHLVWGDYDGDGDLDLATAGPQSSVYRNQGGELDPVPVWMSLNEPVSSSRVAWGDYDDDGDLDLAFAPQGEKIRLFANRRNNKHLTAPGAGITWTNAPLAARANGYAALDWTTETTVPLAIQSLASACAAPRAIQGFYSLDKGGTWQAMDLAMESSSEAIQTVAWNTWTSGFFGQSDDVVLRLVALPAFSPCGGTPVLYQYGSTHATSLPFPMGSNQVQVLTNDQPEADILLYRIAPDDVRGDVLRSATGLLLTTNTNGYLRGYSAIAPGDSLVALHPITHTATYTLYHTSAAPTVNGVDTHTVTEPGTQILRVSPDNPLVLFNLAIGLEWDARRDTRFLDNLEESLLRAAESLYDWSNGQATLGDITIYHARENWNDVHIRIYATNRMRPSAPQGGIVSTDITDPLKPAIRYAPGQIRMGAVWNRYGEQDSTNQDDWASALAHELGHYALFLNDNYFGFDGAGRFVFVDTCPGAMSDPYQVEASEFASRHDWLPACATTYSHQDTGRSDWETITSFYPALHAPTTVLEEANSGPSILPLAVMRLATHEPETPPQTLRTPIFSLVTADGERANASEDTQVFLFQDDYILSLGHPRGDEIYAYGAQPGDRICAFDIAKQRFGCHTITSGSENLPLSPASDWQPDTVITPVTSQTVTLSVADIPANLTLLAQLYPINGAPSKPVVLRQHQTAGTYTATLELVEPSFEGYLHIWVDEPDGTGSRREFVAEYTIAGNPGSRRRSHRTPEHNPGSRRRSHRAPIMSADGQVLLFNRAIDFQTGTFYTFQSVTRPPDPPPGRTLVGQAYRLTPSALAPDLAGTTISFEYLGRDVPVGEEEGLAIYAWDGVSWNQMPTIVDTENNAAAASLHEPGLYALMSGIEITFENEGWDLLPYTSQSAQPIEDALESISGLYTHIYHYVGSDSIDPWKLYAPDAPPWVNELFRLQPDTTYWIRMTQPATLYISSAVTPTHTSSAQSASVFRLASNFPQPPATYYGFLASSDTLTVTADMPITARIGNEICGQTATHLIDDEVVYVLDVPAATTEKSCGVPGSTVTLHLADLPDAATVPWNNEQLHQQDLNQPEDQILVYLPRVTRQ